MTISAILKEGFLAGNGYRRYPLHEDADGKDLTGSFRLPDDFLVDGRLPVHADDTLDPTKFHVLTAAVAAGGVVIGFGYDGTAFGSITIEKASHVRWKSYRLTGTGRFYDTVGSFVVNSLDTILKSPGFFTFDVDSGRLETAVIHTQLRGVSAFYFRNGADLIGPLQGDLVLEALRNTSLAWTSGAGTPESPNRVTISAVEGAGLSEDCGCGPPTGPCVQTISGVGPDDDGNIDLLEGACIALESLANGIKLTDECADPCCGCEQIDILKTDLQSAVEQIRQMLASQARLEANQNALSALLLTNP